MKQIFKYPINLQGIDLRNEFHIFMPIDAEILSIQVQREKPYIWALVDSTNRREDRYFVLKGTGHDFGGNEGKYIGTFQLFDGNFIGHLFEKK